MTETDGLTSRIDDDLNNDAWKSDEARRLTSESMFFTNAEMKEKTIKAKALGWFPIEVDEVVGKELKFAPPERVNVIGSHASGGCFNISMHGESGTDVDLAIEIPRSFFQEKDYLDHRYHFKRAVYLDALHKKLSKSSKWACELNDQHGDPRKPYIKLHFGEKDEKKTLRLFPTISPETFPAVRLLPSRGNLRSLEKGEGERSASPYYNQSIAEDMYSEAHAKYFAEASAKAKSLPGAVIVFKRWAQARKLLDVPGGINGFFISMLLAYMAQKGGQLSSSMDINQMFRAALNGLAKPEFFKKGLFMHSKPAEVAEWHGAFSHVFLGPGGHVNIMARISDSAVKELIYEATVSAAALKKSGPSALGGVVLSQFPAPVRYDLHLHVEVGISEDETDGDLNAKRAIERKIAKVVSRAMTDRAKLVHAHEVPNLNIDDIGSVTCKFWVGIVLDPENALRLVDIGPSSADDVAAKKFRAFWGEKSELRRFKDGRICESVVWDHVGPADRHHIPSMVAECALKQNIPEIDEVEWSAKLFDEPLSKIVSSKEGVSPAGLLQTLDRLAKRMRDLKEIPLKVNNVQPLSCAFRGTDPFPPTPHPLAHGAGVSLGTSEEDIPVCPKTLDILVQLEGSGRWPEDPESIEKTKAMMALQLAEQMRKSYAMPHIISEDAVDILFEGYAFRIHVSAAAGGPHVKATEAKLLERAAHAGLIASVAARFPMYGISTQLINRWVSSHMFSPHLSDEAIEALVGILFVSPNAALPPMSREVAFLRFLNLLTNHMWYDPVVLDPEDAVPAARIEGIDRASKHAPAMCIVTPHDETGSSLTKDGPSSVVLKRLVAIAARSTSEMEAVLEGASGHSMFETACWERFFKPSLSGFDAAFIIRKSALPFPKQALFPSKRLYKRMRAQFENEMSVVDEDDEETLARSLKLAKLPPKLLNKGPDKAREALLVGFDPISYFVKDLESRLGGTALVFVDKYGGDTVGFAFKPNALHIDAQLPEELSWLPKPNPPSREDVIEELATISGADFVEKVLST